MNIKFLRTGSIVLLASIVAMIVLISKLNSYIKVFPSVAASCGGTCRTNCTEDETGQGLGTGGCPANQHNCVPNVCNGVPDAGTSCEKPTTVNGVSIPAGVCVASGTCPAGKNRPGSCNTANTDCCTTASGEIPPGAGDSSCIFDNYQHRGCVQVNNTWMMCDKDPKGETGVAASCTNSGSSGTETGCTDKYPNCNRAGTYCINPSQICIPSVAQYANCVSDSSCFPTNPPGSSTPTPTPTPTHTPTMTPTATPTATPTPTPTSTPTATPTVTPTATPTNTPTSTPNYCNGTCGSNSNCQSGYFCYNGYCRNPSCQDESDCSCGKSTPTPPPVLGATAPPSLPKTGSNLLEIVVALSGVFGIGLYFFKKFKLI